MTAQAFPFVTSIGLLFGTSLLASRFVLSQLDSLSFVELRLIVAGLCFGLFMWLRPKHGWPRDRQLWLRSAILGVFGTAVPMTCIISSLEYQSSGVSGLLLTTSPAFSILLAHFFLSDEPLTRYKSIGIVLAIGGAALLALSGESGLPEVSRVNPIGYLLVFAAILSGGMMNIFTRKFVIDYDALEVSGIRTLAAALVVAPLAVLFGGFDLHAVDIHGYAALLYCGVAATFFGVLLLVYSIQRFGVTATVMVDYIIPIVTLIGGALFMDEVITPVMLGGMVAIVLGIVLIRYRRAPKIRAIEEITNQQH